MSDDTPYTPPTAGDELPVAPGPYPVRYLIHSLPNVHYTGDALDITPRGFRLQTRHPIPTDECLEIELSPRNGDKKLDPLLVRGQVLCCESNPDGGYLLSIKAVMKFPENEDDLEATPVAGGTAAMPPRPTKTASPDIAVPPSKPHIHLSDLKGPMLVVALLLLLLLLLFPVYRMVLDTPSGTLVPRDSAEHDTKAEEDVEEETDIAPLSAPPVDSNHAQAALRDVLRSQPEEAVIQADTPTPMPPLDEALPGDIPPYTSEALDGATASMEPEGAPLPPAEAYPVVETAHDSAPETRPPAMYPALFLKPASASAQKQQTRYIQIKKSGHELSYYEDQQLLATFPVGLGEADSTPEGHFVIANKILHPDWFNKGDTVKAGDPENPLGDHWMGLGRNGKATSYGIHPTNERNSIGADMSRGCIRMYPDDAKQLFAWCEVGTPVQIVP